jgi:hypothetical protein
MESGISHNKKSLDTNRKNIDTAMDKLESSLSKTDKKYKTITEDHNNHIIKLN